MLNRFQFCSAEKPKKPKKRNINNFLANELVKAYLDTGDLRLLCS